jgi:CDP-diacylglycerol--serine O-phosphatidyltransferase
MVLDSLDGRVARMTNTQSAFGEQMDSLCDMVSFGLAPALIVYEWSLKGLGKAGWIVAFIYCAAAALRLARFNTNIGVVDKRFFQGLPSPAAAACALARASPDRKRRSNTTHHGTAPRARRDRRPDPHEDGRGRVQQTHAVGEQVGLAEGEHLVGARGAAELEEARRAALRQRRHARCVGRASAEERPEGLGLGALRHLGQRRALRACEARGQARSGGSVSS